MRKGKGDYMGEITVTFSEYFKEQIKFVNKHNKNGVCKVVTTQTDSGGLCKEFRWEDGGVFRHTWHEETELISGVWRTVYWSSDNYTRKCFYEQD